MVIASFISVTVFMSWVHCFHVFLSVSNTLLLRGDGGEGGIKLPMLIDTCFVSRQ